MILPSADPPDERDEGEPDHDRTVRPEDVRAYFAEYPETPAGLDVTPMIAAQKARRLRPDLSDQDFAVLFAQALPTVRGYPDSIVEEILAYIGALRPPRPRARRPGRPRLREQDLRRELIAVLAEFKAEGEDRPTREEIAEKLAIEPSTLRRRLHRFPGLRALLPSSGRPRRA